MINTETYLKIVELVKTQDDLEAVEAFLYNRGKFVIDKKALYEDYCEEDRNAILETNSKPKRRARIKLGI